MAEPKTLAQAELAWAQTETMGNHRDPVLAKPVHDAPMLEPSGSVSGISPADAVRGNVRRTLS